MKTIKIQRVCKIYNISSSFIERLREFELIEIINIENEDHLNLNDINKLEKLTRLHFDLNVNIEALDIINHMTLQIETLQTEVKQLTNRLSFYEKL